MLAVLQEHAVISITSAFQQLHARLGPGLLFAAAAVGTSHLVQSTRAGASYGLTLGLLIIIVCALKYPLFRFACDYAAVTGESLVSGYHRRGMLLVVLMFVVSAIEAVAAVAGVSLVTAGIARWLFDIQVSDLTTALTIMAFTAMIVGIGRYRLLESVAGVFVILFSVLTLIATAASVPQLIAGGDSLFGRFEATTANLSFATAVAGWMPIGNTAAIMLAAWVLAKKEEGRTEVSQARFDFNLGYLASVVLALCFLIMGAAVLYGAQIETAGGGAQFAKVFVDMFAAAVGEWTRTLVAVAALCVMYSTLLAILDGFPRMLQNFLQELGLISSSRAREQLSFRVLLLVVVAAAGTFLLYFLSSFTAFIDLVTITGFLAAPVVAWINYAVITGDNVPRSAQPGRALVIWNYLAIAALLVASGGFLYFRFLA